MRPAVHRFTRRIGRRGAALLFLFFLDAVYAYSLFYPAPEVRQSTGIRFIATLMPLWAWGLLWAAAGLVCLIGAFMRSDKWSFAAAIGVKTLWGLIYLGGAFIGLDRAYLSAAIWLIFAIWVAIIASWPEVWDAPRVVAERRRQMGRGE